MTKKISTMDDYKCGAINDGIQNIAYATEYHNRRKDQRRSFSLNLLSRIGFLSKNMNFISLCCGFAGEESLLVPHFANTVLLDQHPKTIDLTKQIYTAFCLTERVEFIAKSVQEYVPEKKFNIIYTSSPSDWMKNPVGPMPEHYANFISKHLHNCGVFIARLYGGSYTHNGNKEHLNDENFCSDMNEYISKYGLEIIEWEVCPERIESNVLIIGKSAALPIIKFDQLDSGVSSWTQPKPAHFALRSAHSILKQQGDLEK